MVEPFWRGTFERDIVNGALQFKVYVDSLGNPFSDEKSKAWIRTKFPDEQRDDVIIVIRYDKS
jgi:hypothetical protein